MQNIINGFIIESEKSGYYYHRTRGWIKYDSPERAYVWTEEETKMILAAAAENPSDWKLKPGSLHPATFFSPVAGRVVLNHPEFKAKDFGKTSIYKGGIVGEQPNKFRVVSNLVSSDVTL